jgi:hypothetical protein
MKSGDAILVALLVVLILMIAYHSCNNKREGFLGGWADDKLLRFEEDARAISNDRLFTMRGHHRNDGYRQSDPWERPVYVDEAARHYAPQQPYGLDRFHQTGRYLTPEDITNAEQQDWYDYTAESNTGNFNAELAADSNGGDTMQYHTAEPAINYGDFITDMIIDPRTKENHNKWVEEMKPFSGGPMMVDNMDEAIEASIDFRGLRRPQAVVQNNPLFITEIDTRLLASNCPFNFRC